MALFNLNKIPVVGGLFQQADQSWKAYMGESDYRTAQDNLAYQKALQQEIFRREDNSVQRRVADLEKAGLSKVLAAGQGAAAGAIVHTESPKWDASRLGNIPGMIATMMQQKAQTSKTRTDEELAKEQIETQKTQQNLNNTNALKNTVETIGHKLDNIIKGIDARNSEGTNMGGKGTLSQELKNVWGGMMRIGEKTKEDLMMTKDYISNTARSAAYNTQKTLNEYKNRLIKKSSAEDYKKNYNQSIGY